MCKMNNQSGSALLYSLVTLSVLGGTSFFMFQKSQDAKNTEANLAINQSVRILKRKLSAVLSDPETCKKNFETIQVPLDSESAGTSLNQITNGKGNPIYENGKFYYGRSIRFSSINVLPHPTDPSNRFMLEVNISKAFAQNVPRQNQTIRFDIGAGISGNTIQNCKYEGALPSNLQQIYEEQIELMCRGPGMISNSNGQCVIANPHNGLITCENPGEAIRSVSVVNNRLVANCTKIITQLGGPKNMPCTYGIKYKGTAGKYTCLTLNEIVNSTPANASAGRKCRIEVGGDGKFVFKCYDNSSSDLLCMPVNGRWSSPPWSACVSGTQSRTRQCNAPAPSCGGSGCTGSPNQTRACTSPPVLGGP